MNRVHTVLAMSVVVVGLFSNLGARAGFQSGETGYWPWHNLAPTGTLSAPNGGSTTGLTNGNVGSDATGTGNSLPYVWYDRFAAPAELSLIRLSHAWGVGFDSWELAYDTDPTSGESFSVLASGTGSDLGRMTSVDADITTDGLRYTVTSATQSNLCGREVEAYGPASLAAATITGDVVTSVASSVAKGNAANLVNGQLSPDWGAWQPASLGSTTPEYVYYLFPEERPIHSVRVIGEQGNMPSVLYLQYLMAGGNPANNNDWITWDSKTGLPNDWRTVWLHHGATGFFESTGVRILIEGNQNTSGYNWFRLFEIEIYDGSLAIPEPASVIMLGAAGLLMLRRRVRS